jgi:hypothetical protein
MVAPLLPGAEGLAAVLKGKIDYLLLDRMHYHHADRVYRKFGLEEAMSNEFYDQATRELRGM